MKAEGVLGVRCWVLVKTKTYSGMQMSVDSGGRYPPRERGALGGTASRSRGGY
jgi:hypothetical protein